MTKLISAGGDPASADYDGRTPAHLAAAEGRLTVRRHCCYTSMVVFIYLSVY